MTLKPPVGLEGITAVFGDISRYIDGSGTLSVNWQVEKLGYIMLPTQIPLAWDKTILVSRMRCHKLLTEVFDQVFTQIKDNGLTIQSFGGCFQYRQQRTGAKLSTHAWGIAIDLNPDTNQQGTEGDMDPRLVDIFTQAGFEWGGSWSGPVRDPMHFQFCTNY